MIDDPYILVIEDDKSILNYLSVSLRTNGYRFETVKSGLDGISLFMANNPDLILLDLGLPDIDGIEVLRQIRMSSDTPVIVVSARGEEDDKVGALDLGADDYVTKPFRLGELLARIRVALRKRQPKVMNQPVFQRRGLRIDFEMRKVSVDGTDIHLTPMEYSLLTMLADNSGKVLTHGFISRGIWGHVNPEDFRSLRVCMANLRRKIEMDSGNPRYILTEVGVGYRFAEDAPA